jgi:hypothetical protein
VIQIIEESKSNHKIDIHPGLYPPDQAFHGKKGYEIAEKSVRIRYTERDEG